MEEQADKKTQKLFTFLFLLFLKFAPRYAFSIIVLEQEPSCEYCDST